MNSLRVLKNILGLYLAKTCKITSLLIAISGLLLAASEVESQKPEDLLIYGLAGIAILLSGGWLFKIFDTQEKRYETKALFEVSK